MKTKLIPLLAVMLLLLCSCSKSENVQKEHIVFWGHTWYEDGMFYEQPNADGELVLYYCSKDSGRSAAMCGTPECTHLSRSSPDCGALGGSDTMSRYGYNRAGDKLYWIAAKLPDEKSIGSLDLMECDIDGKNRRVAASIKETFSPFVNGVKYIGDKVLVTYYKNFDMVKNEGTGEYEFVQLEKYLFYVMLIDIKTGNVETLLTREEYDGYGHAALVGEKLYYNYTYHIEPPTGEMYTPETAPELYGGFYIRDLSTGEEKEFQNIQAYGTSYDYFAPEAIVGYDRVNHKLCRFDPETETFSVFADYNNDGYASDGKDALFASDPEHWTRYNFETGELSPMPRYSGENAFELYSAYPVGDTVWLNLGDSLKSSAYMSRDDFFNGKFDNITMLPDDPKPTDPDSQDPIDQNPIDQNPDSAQNGSEELTVIRWGISATGDSEKAFKALNERLAEEGLQIAAVSLDLHSDTNTTFAELILEYEREYGSFDIVTYGSDWVYKVGAVNLFMESGYFRELGAEDMSAFTDVPEICWNAATVNGKHYTIPALNFGLDRDIGLHFHFNTKYISEEKLQNFNGTVAELADILSGIVPNEKMTALEFQPDYLRFTEYMPASEMGGMYLSDKTMRAENPYEAEEVVEYARALNGLYKSGYMNYDIDFSDWTDGEMINSDFAVSVCGGRIDETELKKRLGTDNSVIVYSKPYYMENRLLNSTGIPVNSAHPDEAMELLKRLHEDAELSGLLTEAGRDAIGLPRDNKPVDVGEIKLSPFAGFRLKYTVIDDYKAISELSARSFDKLCKAEDFDGTLAEINAELKAAGIDEYVSRVNRLLEENYAASNKVAD